MKKYLRSSKYGTVDIEFDVYLPVDEVKVAATDIVDLYGLEKDADPLAVENYKAFVESVKEIFSYYDFEICSKNEKSPTFSKYYFYAHQSQISAGSVPKYVRVRISSHVEQHKSEEHKKKIKDEINKELNRIKLPKTKKKQRYMPLYITADRTLNFKTYEEVLDYAEERVRNLFYELNLSVDLREYDEIGPF